jgi:dethiobiotin synthetase
VSTHSSDQPLVRRIVVLGTGTAVGKTWVAVHLARALRSLSQAVSALKPIESGVSAAANQASDAELLANASSSRPADPPYRLPDPVSPHLAARRASLSITLHETLTYVQSHTTSSAARARPDWILVETAGAVLSPLAPDLTNWDLARALEPAVWVLVAPDALGVLHDLSATLEVLRARGREPDHVVLSAARQADASTGTNAAELASLGIVQPSANFARDSLAEFESFAKRLLARS